MATLTEAAYVTRRGIKYSALGFVGILVFWFVGTSAVAWWKATHPEPPPPPTADFGKLPALKLPANKISVSEYSLQTPDGKLGRFSDRMWVFFAPPKRSSFSDEDEALELARKLDFLFEPTKLSGSQYRWSKTDPLPSSLEINIISKEFDLVKQWQADPSLIVNKKFIGDKQVILDAQTFLRQAGLLNADLTGKEKLNYLRVQGSNMVPAISLSEADFVEVNTMRKPFEIVDDKKTVLQSYDFYTQDPSKGLVSTLVAGTTDVKKKIIQVSYKYREVEYETKGEYPIKTAEQAFEELKAGRGYVASYTGSGVAVIRRVNLGYYEPTGEQKYVMPIYIYTGDDDFVAYLSAVSDEQILAE